ncbi:MAG TPA: STAS domain-containing protein [Polyangium sp.]|nr:STAS domain-containing protein [Polyangium sp.]
MSRSPRLRGRLIAGIRERRARGIKSVRAGAPSVLLEIIRRCRNEIADRATDWVIAAAPDLRGLRPRDETKQLVERVIDVNQAVIEHDDRQPLRDFIEFVTSFRASLEFRVSTILRGFLSFKRGLGQVLREERYSARETLAVLAIVDEIYYEAIFEISDVYGAKLVQTIKTRRDEIQTELGKKREELELSAEMLETLRAEFIKLSLPILPIWKGVLLVPLIGEISPARAEHARQELLEAVGAHQTRIVLIDVTGLGLIDGPAASVLSSLIRAVKLLGAETMIVGVRGHVARVLVHMGEVFPGTPTFATLDEGLRRALRMGSAYCA